MLNIYPNPATGSEVNVEFEILESGFYQIFMSNVIGQDIHPLVSSNLTRGHYEITMPLDNFSSGDIWCILVGDKYKVSRKFIYTR